MPFLYKFQYSLHAGATVEWLLGIMALLWAIDHGTATWLTLRTVRTPAAALVIRRGVSGYKLAFDLHRVVGIWLLAVTLAIAVSGIYFNLNKEFRAVVEAFSPLSPSPDAAHAALPAP